MQDTGSDTIGELNNGKHKINKNQLTCDELSELLTVAFMSYATPDLMNLCTPMNFELPVKSSIDDVGLAVQPEVGHGCCVESLNRETTDINLHFDYTKSGLHPRFLKLCTHSS